jgi:hypothetical protein
VTNRGDRPLVILLAGLRSPSTAVEIVDAEGRKVLQPPPPVPRGDRETVELEPGESFEVSYPSFVPPETPPGRYRARLRYVHYPGEPVAGQEKWFFSDWAELTVETSR